MHRLGHRLGERVEQLERPGASRSADRVGERPRPSPGPPPRRAPRRPRPRRRVGPVERELVEFASTLDASGSGARRRSRGRTPRSASRAPSRRPAPSRMPRSRASPSIQAASAPSFGDSNAADLAAGRLDRRRRAASARVLRRRSATASTKTSALPGGDERDEREERVTVLVADGERAGVRHDRQRAAAEHRLASRPAVDLADLDAGRGCGRRGGPSARRLAAVRAERPPRSGATARSIVRSSSPQK